MKKYSAKRKKQGMALIFTLFVSVLVMAMATSYLGMTISGQKAARAYTQEATALSLAQIGVDAIISAMGNRDNWHYDFFNRTDVFKDGVNAQIRLPIGINAFDINANNGIRLSNNNNLDGLALDDRNPADITPWFADFIDFNNLQNVSAFYSAGPIRIPDGNGTTKNGFLLFAIRPESINAIRVNNVNLNLGGDAGGEGFIIGIVSLIFNNNGAPNAFDMATVLNDDNFVSSRVIQVRVSDKEVGGIYENIASASFPNSRHASQGVFGTIPSWAEFTADAAFIDENTVWNSDLVVDGANPNTGFGAPAEAMNNVIANRNNYQAFSQTEVQNYIAGNANVDVSGILKISTLNGINHAGAANLDADDLPEFSERISAQKATVYSDLFSGQRTLISQNNNLGSNIINMMGSFQQANAQGNIIQQPHRNFSYQDDVRGTRVVDSIWGQDNNGNNNRLMSGTTGAAGNAQPSPGLYNQLFQNSNANHGVFIFDGNDYRPDPMYANETMEVPTIRITINPPNNNNGTDTYTVERIEYVWNNGNWQENVAQQWQLDRNDLTVNQNNQNIATNAIYVAGANVQVQGRATQSISIISDVNPNVEADNANGTGVFDDGLNAPNVLNGNAYQFVDMEDVIVNGEPNGQVDINNNININPNANQHISQVANLANVNGAFHFPTYDADDEPPTGNITVIGDLVQAEGSNPVIGLIASNRILLNDFNHNAQPAQNAVVPNRDAAETAAAASRNNAVNGQINQDDRVLNVDAVIASERFNMAFDFNNSSKNLNYSQNNNIFDANRAPGDGVVANNAPALDIMEANNGNFGKLMTQDLAQRLGFDTPNNLIATNGNQDLFFVNQYTRMLPQQAQRQIWNDAFMGAIRPGNPEANTMFYGDNILNFRGMIISRYADINADAGTRQGNGRVDQLGYTFQIMNRDNNLYDSCPPLFAMSKNRSTSERIPRWRVITYIDNGATH